MMKTSLILPLFAVIFCFVFSAVANDGNLLDARTMAQLENTYPGARIQWQGDIPRAKAGERLVSAYESRPGVMRATIASEGSPHRVEEYVFRALRGSWIAKRRIRPGESLLREDFVQEELDLTEPLIHEVKGLILSSEADLGQYESRVTILEGQFPIASGVQKIPAVKRGELIRILLRSGDLEVSAPGVVQEPAQIGGTLKVLTSATKREVSGVLREGKIVEVTL